MCVRILALQGSAKGRGSFFCEPAAGYATNGLIIATSTGGALGPDVFRPGEAIVTGTVPDGVTRVRLVVRRAPAITYRVTHNAFFFATIRPVQRLRFTDPVRGVVDVRVPVCQTCNFSGPPSPAAGASK